MENQINKINMIKQIMFSDLMMSDFYDSYTGVVSNKTVISHH